MVKMLFSIQFFLISLSLFCFSTGGSVGAADEEIREYQGQSLSPFDRAYDNSIKGPQTIARQAYRLVIDGLVARAQSLTYEQVLALPQVKSVQIMPCVEGWSETLLFEGPRLTDLLSLASPQPGVTTIIFHAADGYSSSVDYAYAQQHDLILAARINGLVLNAQRGFPFQVVIPGKLGYKWVKWINRIELSDKPYQGFWERRGYSNEADAPTE